jgi:hypothetical protein
LLPTTISPSSRFVIIRSTDEKDRLVEPESTLNRQSERYRREGIDLSLSTLADMSATTDRSVVGRRGQRTITPRGSVQTPHCRSRTAGGLRTCMIDIDDRDPGHVGALKAFAERPADAVRATSDNHDFANHLLCLPPLAGAR